MNDLIFEIKLWDIAGQEKYKNLTKLFTKEAKIAILVYWIDNEKSFNSLDNWLKLVNCINEDDLVLGIAGNKSDLASDKTISNERGEEYAKKIRAIFKSTSAMMEDGGIEELIDNLFHKYYSIMREYQNYNSIYILVDDNSTFKKGGLYGGRQRC